MKTLYRVRISSVVFSVVICISLVMPATSYSAMNDSSDRLSSEQSGVFSPGYINAAKQKTDAVINQLNTKGSFMDSVSEFVKDKLANKVTEDSQNAVVPELRRKTGSGSETSKGAGGDSVKESVMVVDSTEYNVKIGTGSSQLRDANGNLLSEVIDDRRHIYAGFDDSGTSSIREAINRATAGDIVIVRGGSYDLGGSYLNMKNGVSLYGGYNSSGERNIAGNSTVLSNGGIYAFNIDKATEINGLTISNPYGNHINDMKNGIYRTSYYGIYTYNSTDDLKVLNNTIISGYMGIYTINSKAVVFNNSISGQSWSAIYTSNSSLNVSNNRIYNTCFGITETYRSGSVFQNNVIWGNYTNFIIHGNSTSTIDSNTVYGGSEGVRYHCSAPTVTNNIFVKTPQAIRIDDSYNMGTSQIIASGNVFYGYTTLGVSLSTLSSGQNQNNLFDDPGIIDPTKGVYSSSLLDKGYSVKNITTDYNKITISNSMAQSIARSISENSQTAMNKDYKSVLGEDRFSVSIKPSYAYSAPGAAGNNSLGSMFKSLILAKEGRESDMAGNSGRTVFVKDDSGEFAIAIPAGILKESPYLDSALILTNILNNPNEEQKLLIDVAQVVIKMAEESASQELKKASDDLIQAVAAILIAQAIPDLLKEGDVSNIKDTFSELNSVKSRILIEYGESIKPYYEEMKKLLSDNIAILQLNNIISKNMAEQELAKLEPNGVDKILEKLRKASNKSFDEEYILQQEAKYRKQYIDPNKKVIEDKMKDMMKDFARKLSKIMEPAGAGEK